MVSGYFNKTWKLIHELRGKQKQSVKSFFIINGDEVENRRKIANESNNYFISVATKLNESNEYMNYLYYHSLNSDYNLKKVQLPKPTQ